MKNRKRSTIATNKINKRSDCKKLVGRKVKGNKEQKIQGENRIYVRATGTYSSCFVNRILNVHLRTIQNSLCFIALRCFEQEKQNEEIVSNFQHFVFSTRFFSRWQLFWCCDCVGVCVYLAPFLTVSRSLFGTVYVPKNADMLNCTFRLSGRIAYHRSNNCLRKCYVKNNNNPNSQILNSCCYSFNGIGIVNGSNLNVINFEDKR